MQRSYASSNVVSLANFRGAEPGAQTRGGPRLIPRHADASTDVLHRALMDFNHRTLTEFNRVRLAPSKDADTWQTKLADEIQLRVMEGKFLQEERAAVRERAAQAPTEPQAFLAWFEALEECGPGQHDPLFDWLAEHASREQMRWFLRQEMAGEAGFDDLVALTQVKISTRSKLELARNYWDEMGQGHLGGMHGPLLDQLATEMEIPASTDLQEIVWEALALGNLMVGFAANRHYAYQSIGALGAIELTAPGRAEKVNAGLKRLGVGGAARRYFALHATLDRKHSAAWNAEVLWPLLEAQPGVAPLLAEGALARLSAGSRCFSRYREELGVS